MELINNSYNIHTYMSTFVDFYYKHESKYDEYATYIFIHAIMA